MVNKGDNAWMLVSTALVLMMSIPGLALFYGGLVRTKNMLSVLMQVFMIISICTVTWCLWGYSMTFTAGSGWSAPFWGGFSKTFLHGVDATTVVATFSNNVYLPEYTYVCFQATFAIITAALIIGSLADRVKFWPLMLFMGASIAAIRLQRLTDPYVSLTDVGFWPNADAETSLTIRPLSGVKRM